MQETKNYTTNTPQQIRKTIGNTTYEVSVHFSQSSTRNAHDKLKRIIRVACQNSKGRMAKIVMKQY